MCGPSNEPISYFKIRKTINGNSIQFKLYKRYFLFFWKFIYVAESLTEAEDYLAFYINEQKKKKQYKLYYNYYGERITNE